MHFLFATSTQITRWTFQHLHGQVVHTKHLQLFCSSQTELLIPSGKRQRTITENCVKMAATMIGSFYKVSKCSFIKLYRTDRYVLKSKPNKRKYISEYYFSFESTIWYYYSLWKLLNLLLTYMDVFLHVNPNTFCVVNEFSYRMYEKTSSSKI